MNNNDSFLYIEQTIDKMAVENGVPREVVPKIITLLKKYPDLSVYGSKSGLRRDLERILDNLQNQGYFDLTNAV